MSAEIEGMADSRPVTVARVNGLADVGKRAEVIETFYWRIEGEGKAPLPIKVRPNAKTWAESNEIERRFTEARANATKLNKLILKRAEFEVDAMFDERPEKEDSPTEQLEKCNRLIAELEQQQTPSQVLIQDFFLPVIAEWPLTIEGEPVPLTEEGLGRLDEWVLLELRRDLNDFFSDRQEDRNKRRKR